jgi:hypothetical protein
MFDTGRQDRSSGIGPGRSPLSDAAPVVVDGWETAPTGVRGVLPEDLSTMAPGPELATALAGIDRSALNGYELVILVQAERRQVAHYEAASFETMTELAHCAPGYAGSPPERHSEIDEFAADELRAALMWTRRAAANNLGLALDVVERFPLVLSKLAAGKIDVPRVRTIVHTLAHLETRQIHQITEEVINRATEMTTGQLGAMLRRRAITADPDSAEKRYHKAGTTAGSSETPTPTAPPTFSPTTWACSQLTGS